MKIALVYPPTTVFEGDPSVGSQIIPLGLAYIAAVCEKEHEVKIFDFSANTNVEIHNGHTYYGTPKIEILAELHAFKPDILGIQCMYSAYAEDAYEIARVGKILGCLTVMGGAHASACYLEVLKNPEVDLVVIGEGEETFLEIIQKFRNKENLSGIRGTAGNPARPLVKDIDSLPPPALHLLPIKEYLEKTKETFNMRPAMFVVTSRGCPYNCKFCSVRSVWKGWRYHSPKRVVDEIEALIKNYKVGEIHFIDDNIAVDINRLKNICDELIKRKVNIKWTTPNGITIWTLDNEALEKMKQSGCYRLTFGIETASLNTQRYIRKTQIDLEKAKEVIRKANRLGIWTLSTFIIGFPDETLCDVVATVDFALKSDLDFAFFFLPMLFPHTDMTEDYRQRGLLLREGKFLSGRCGVATEHFTGERLNDIQKGAYKDFIKSRMKRPFKVLEKIKSLEDLRYCTKLAVKGIKYAFGHYT
jgi:magnesium-protoporphyrin IX monomethyl ester (oxidative) cyclase